MDTKLAGCCGFGPDRKRYFHQLGLVEVQQTFFFPPKAATLSSWRQTAPKKFVFTVRAWQVITHEAASGSYPRFPKDYKGLDHSQCGFFRPSEAVMEGYARTLAAAEALDAPAIVFETPLDFTPTAVNRRNLSTFFERIERQGRQMVWDPQGLWSQEDIRSIAEDLDLLGCSDPTVDTSEAPGERVYLRLRAPRYSDDELIEISDALAISQGAYCLFNSVNMLKDAQRLQALL